MDWLVNKWHNVIMLTVHMHTSRRISKIKNGYQNYTPQYSYMSQPVEAASVARTRIASGNNTQTGNTEIGY